MYQETINEMSVFQKQMESMLSGNVTLLNEFQAAQMVALFVPFVCYLTIGNASSGFKSIPNPRSH
jgi:hypothetical protein